MNTIALLLASLATTTIPQATDTVDVLIRNGLVYDGSGGPGMVLDVGMVGDRITFVGDASADGVYGHRTLDAQGLIVSPGFIDPHAHAQGDLASDNRMRRENRNYLMQGVTTVVVGNDGHGTHAVGETSATYTRLGIGTNAALLVGFGSVRGTVLGSSDAAPTPPELNEMRGLVDQAMRDGAVGMSTGLFYNPQSYSTTPEVIELAKVAARYGGVYDSHLRDESSYTIGLIAAVQEAIDIGREAGLAVNISHIKALGVDVWGESEAVLKLIADARADGQRVTADQYPYTASGSSINASLLPRWAQAGGNETLLARLDDSETRGRIVTDMTDNLRRRGGAGSLLITGGRNVELRGKTLEEIADEWSLDAIEAAIRIVRDGGAGVASFNMNEDDIATFMSSPFVMTGSDGSGGHPRKYGTFPKKIRTYVLEDSVISMARMIQASSSQPAEVFGLSGRGEISVGAFADIAVFDPGTVRDVATFAEPALLATGMRWVLVNGRFAVDAGQPTGTLSGTVLSRGQTAPPTTYDGMALRSIGPALTTGRISDVAIDHTNKNVWYVGVSSGGVWKTENRGTTWTPIFDDYGSFSIGAVTLDPVNPDVLWIGTGENASQRSASYGDGIYKSVDGGASFRRMGLLDSEHIGDILVDPRDSDVVFAASQGPLWASGGDRGLFKTTDGGAHWERVLHVSDDTGIADIVFDAFNPDVMYASSYQRRRHVGLLVAGGPEGKIFRSEDGGTTWEEIMDGIPNVDLGRIALEVSPDDAGVVYALVAAQGDASGFFRSGDYGSTWVKQSDYVVVDPQYYGELFADPNRPGRLCAVDVRIQCTADEGVHFEQLMTRGVHADHHEIIFDPDDPEYMMLGNDGGLFESFDGARTWRHHNNLPITQFYRVGIDDREPFYWVYGGTQDNGTMGGPSRSRVSLGVRSSDWTRIVGGDGFQARIDPTNPDIVYGMSQGARIQRVDMSTSLSTSIAPPQAFDGDTILWHWDIPLVISRYDNERIYALGSRLLRSDNRGDDWQVLSPNLSREIDRDTLPVMGRVWPEDAVWKNVFTNDYGIGVSFSESRFDENLLYVGTDDGLIQRSEDGGTTWTEMGAFPGLPKLIYVSDVVASRHDPDRVYALFNNHKRGDFTPYAMRSDDRGATWTSIASDLPDRGVTWVLEEDPEREDLLFLGTEFGLFFTLDTGGSWHELAGGAPTIPFRDIEIQERVGDLVVATFGRGFYVLDDYTPLRQITPEVLADDATLFEPRPTPVYDELRYYSAGSGAGEYVALNPDFGALLTYYLSEPVQDAELVIAIRDAAGEVIAEVDVTNAAGLQRATWDLRIQPSDEAGQRRGPLPLVEPGDYTATLETRSEEAGAAPLTPAVVVKVVRLN